ncbi:MAG: tRNA preQ1(34) S-adenosylmethionine ribosyltransferase-isomerase QueA [Phycisphaerales bacterium]
MSREPPLLTRDLEYDLPPGSVAIEPARPRESARLLVASAAGPDHLTIADLPRVLRRGDLLVVNRSRVLAARLVGRRVDSGGGVEGLFLARVAPGEVGYDGAERRWKVMLKARRLRAQMRVQLTDEKGEAGPCVLTLIERAGGASAADGEDEGAWVVGVEGAPEAEGDGALLERIGRTPLPPYIRSARKRAGVVVAERVDRDDYQTCFASGMAEAGSVAAPTAGLHLTPGVLAALGAAGVERTEVSLHVGTGTFKPVECAVVQDHPMHAEWCEVPGSAARAILKARHEGRRVIAVGTTSARTIESFTHEDLCAIAENDTAPTGRWTRVLICPGYSWRHVDGLMTNFHLPRSTLMAMVGALLPGGVAGLRGVYAEAVARGYRFYSYGDAMLVFRG